MAGITVRSWLGGARGFVRPGRTVLFAALLVMVGLVQVTTVGAVHDEGVFELDGNIANGAAAGDDWANLFPTNTSTTALDTFFVDDASDAGQNYFQGSSQDREALADWNWGGNSGPQDKDNITDAYGASYVSPTTGNRLAYVGADRYASNGDSELGFWFFQDDVTLVPGVNGGPGTFSGEHRNNDVLVLADWASDGSTSGIEVWVWDTNATNNLRQIAPSSALPVVPTAQCPAPAVALADDRVCAIGNTSPLTSPWPYTPKSLPGNVDGTIPVGGFFEAGIDLTALGGNVCFTSLLAETRSSHSTATATLQDLVLSSFNTCPPPTIATTSSPTGVQARGFTTTASDTATFSGTFGAVTGTADFFLCGPGLTTASTAAGCPTGGTQYGNDIVLGNNSATSTTTPLLSAAGTYCWRVEYTPSATSHYASGSHTNATSECFTLRDKVAPVIDTTSTPQGVQARGISTTASDRADFSGTLGTVTGTADFFLCGPGQADAASSTTGCLTGGTQYGNDIALSGGSATSTTTASLSTAGLYCWRVEYSGDANYLSGSHTNAGSECFTLRDKAAPVIETTSSPTGDQARGASTTASDTATFSGSLGTPTGTADFFLCGPGLGTVASSTTGCIAGGTQYGDDIALSAGSATSTTTGTLSTAGLYCWRVEYSGDANYLSGSHTNAVSECFTLRDKATPVIATTSSPTGVQARGITTTASDTANFSGSLGTVTGTADFFLCGPGQANAADATTGCAQGGTQYGNDIVLSSGSATSTTTASLSTAGLYCWRVEYSGDANYDPGSHTNNTSECFTLRDKAPAVIETTSSPTGDQARGITTTASDTANFSGSLGTVTGTADFFLCGPGQANAADATTGCAQGGTQYGDDVALSNGSATSATTGSLGLAGFYCWRVEYSGDANYFAGSHTNNTSECFTLRDKAPAVITTDSSPTGEQARGASVSASDTANFSGTLGAVTGTADFFLCGPGQGALASNTTGCSVGGTQYGNDVVISAGSAASSSTPALSTAGVYCWRVEYSGDANYLAGSHTNATSECFTLRDKVPAVITTGSAPTGRLSPGATTTSTDTANFSGSLGAVTGTADFFLCGPGQSNATDAAGCSAGGTQYGNDRPIAGGSATSATTGILTGPGVYCWRVEYSGDANYLPGSHTNAGSECFTLVAPNIIDLSIVKTDDRDPINLGESVIYTLTVTNNSAILATGVVVSDELPAQVTFVSASAGCTQASGLVTCNVGDLAPGASVSFNITVTPLQVGTITDVARVRGNEEDSNPANNVDIEDTDVLQVLGVVIELPKTGADIQALAITGLTLVLIGLGLVGARRRRVEHAAEAA